MALRPLEVTVSEDRLERIPDLVEEIKIIQSWLHPTAKGMGVGRFLLEAAEVETLSDLLVSEFGSQGTFRLVLLPVEATLPVLENEVEEGEEEDDGVEDGASGREGPRRISREELYEDVSQASQVTPVYLVMVALSTVVAAVGLIRGDVAIIIGAMVIAPLLGPNIALSLASTLGHGELARRSLRAIGAGVGVAAAISILFGALLPVDPTSTQLAARTQPGFGDIAIALSAGAAGSLAFTSGVPAVVVGVMVAVALLPPLVTAGLLAGAGFGSGAVGAIMLLITNVACINLAAVATFLAQRVRPRLWWEANRARRATRIAVATWVLTLLVLVALIWLRSFRAV